MTAESRRNKYSNTEVAAMLLGGDIRQETQVYESLLAYFQGIYRYILVTKNGVTSVEQQLQVAEECFTDAFLCFKEKVIAGEFDPYGKASYISWFNKIAWHYFQNALRRQFGRTKYGDFTTGFVAASQDTPLLNRPDGMAKLLRESIQSMPFPCRKYLKWHYIDGKSVIEMELLSGNQGTTIAKNMVQCRKKLRQHLNTEHGIM